MIEAEPIVIENVEPIQDLEKVGNPGISFLKLTNIDGISAMSDLAMITAGYAFFMEATGRISADARYNFVSTMVLVYGILLDRISKLEFPEDQTETYDQYDF